MQSKLTKNITKGLVITAVALPGLITAGLTGQRPTREDIAAKRAERAATRTASPQKQKAPASRVHAGDKQLYGFHCEAFDGDLWGWTGVVKILEGAQCPEPVYEIDGDMVFQAVYMDGKTFVVLHDGSQLGNNVTYQVYDINTWDCEASVEYKSNSPNILPGCLAYDHSAGKVYGQFYASTDSFAGDEDAQLGVVDFSNAFDPVQIIGDLPERMRAMTFDAAGDLYGINYNGDLFKINKFTGDAIPTEVHVDLPTWDGGDPTGGGDPIQLLYTLGRESMCCDWESGDFYMSYGDDFMNTYIARFNPATGGEAEMVADYSYTDYGSWDTNVITGLYFIQGGGNNTETGIPAAATDLTVTAVGTELKAEVSFTMPTKSTNSDALQGELSWVISDGRNELANGTAQPGDKVTETVEVNSGGNNTFVVTVAQGEKVSAAVDARAFIGCDTPYIYGIPTVRAAGLNLTVSWNAAEALNDANLDPVTYNVTRMPDNVIVAEGISETKYTDHITSEIRTLYYYVITPLSGTVKGESVESRKLYAGTYLPLPYTDDFSDEQRFLLYPVIDANNDDNIWEYSNKYQGVAMYPANDNDADDYLLIGPFRMDAGSTYTFQMTAGGHNFRETVAIYAGTDPEDAASFNTELLPPTVIDPMKGDPSFAVSFEPTETGTYYFGIKACTKGASQFIYIYDVAVKGISANMPDMPSELEFTPEATSASLTFRLPEKNLDGTAIESLTEARIYRDNALIGTLKEGLTPGAAVTFSDTDDVTKGYHNYSVSAVSEAGEGKSASGRLWRGADIPSRPLNLRIWEDLNDTGLLHITFDHPERGYYGGYLNPKEIRYYLDYLVMGASAGVVELGYGTEHTFRIPGEIKAQDIFAGSVYGGNNEGTISQSFNWTTQVCYFGPALKLPLTESWAGMSQKSGIWGGQAINEKDEIGNAYWDIRDGSAGTTLPQDGDGGFLGLSSTVDHAGKRILSPRITLEGTKTPALVFYYRYTKGAEKFDIEVITDDKPIKTLINVPLKEEGAGKWTRMEVPLTDFLANKYIQLAFTGVGSNEEDFISIDNVTISDLKANDLSLIKFTAPVKVAVNDDAELSATIRNCGYKPAAGKDYTVDFYKNGELIESVEGRDIDPDKTLTFTTSDATSVTDPEEVKYHVEISYEADADLSNNTAKPVTTRIIMSDYPVVTDLEAIQSDNSILLSWSDPDMSQIPGVSVTETFETYEPFIIDNIGSWGIYDGDGSNTVKMATSMGTLDYPHIGEAMAWQVFDPGKANVLHSAWYARSGSNMLVSFQAATSETREIKCDDWLISPELNGSEQEISFYARTGLKAYSPELFDFMISDKTGAVTDFSALAENVKVEYADDWTEFRFRVPAGTRYFAIVHKSVDKLALLVDDITYIPAGSTPVQLDLMGFNVYRDSQRLNEELIADNSYEDYDVEPASSHTYQVTAVWDKGESRLSEPATILVSTGIAGLDDYELTISGLKGLIRIAGGRGENTYVYDTAGHLVASAKTEGVTLIPVQAGIYIVRAGSSVAKVKVY
ncbi:MAG: choice-of-anchor J domain-containing protein [Muribaculaceae bacterium]|nr:choice-of-anchor J domain-containing protein [Muribaculaceae bacterium]